MSKQYKCHKCKQLVDAELIVQVYTSNNTPKFKLCKVCYKQYQAEQERKENTGNDADAYRKLCTYIFENLYDCKNRRMRMPLQIISQIKSYVSTDYGCSYHGILKTLQYYHEILQKEMPNEPSIGMVPYYYEEASRFFQEKARLKQHSLALGPIDSVPVLTIDINEEDWKSYNDSYDNSWRLKENLISIADIEVDLDEEE